MEVDGQQFNAEEGADAPTVQASRARTGMGASTSDTAQRRIGWLNGGGEVLVTLVLILIRAGSGQKWLRRSRPMVYYARWICPLFTNISCTFGHFPCEFC